MAGDDIDLGPIAGSRDADLVASVLAQSRADVLHVLEGLFAERRRTGYGPLYDLLADYPFREGKGLRPAICLSACGAAGGHVDQALNSAAAIELFHNAFLVHDDVEDGSQFRRGQVTLLESHGVPVAVNVGDATNVLALDLLLRNTESIGVRKTLLIFREVERMARESAEGQAIELGWIAAGEFDLADRDYVRMAYKKTCWYTVIAPLRIGVLCGSLPGPQAPRHDELLPLVELGFLAGIAFQIHDDLLNLEADEALYGKEIGGDLWEGKRTIMLLHFLRTAPAPERDRAIALLQVARSAKSEDEVNWLLGAMRAAGSLAHGRALAREYSERALGVLDGCELFAHRGEHRQFLHAMLRYVIERAK